MNRIIALVVLVVLIAGCASVDTTTKVRVPRADSATYTDPFGLTWYRKNLTDYPNGEYVVIFTREQAPAQWTEMLTFAFKRLGLSLRDMQASMAKAKTYDHELEVTYTHISEDDYVAVIFSHEFQTHVCSRVYKHNDGASLLSYENRQTVGDKALFGRWKALLSAKNLVIEEENRIEPIQAPQAKTPPVTRPAAQQARQP